MAWQKLRARPLLTVIIAWVWLAVSAVAWACAEEVPTAPVDCSRVAENLVRIANASDPMTEAQQAGVPTVNGAVRVVVELVPERETPADLPGTVEARYLEFVQVLIEPARLCELASHEAVLGVRAPFRGAPAAPGRPPLSGP